MSSIIPDPMWGRPSPNIDDSEIFEDEDDDDYILDDDDEEDD